MAVPMTVPPLGSDEGEARMAEWYQPDGSQVERGQPVYRLETDYAAVEVEAEQDGVLRHRASAGANVRPGSVVAFITAPGERAPKDPPRAVSEKAATPAVEAATSAATRRAQAAPPPPPLVSPRSRARARALAAAHATPVNKQREANAQQASPLRAAVGEVSSTVDPQADSEWEPRPEGEDEMAERPASLLLFPRILEELRDEATSAVVEEPEEEEWKEFEPPADIEPPTRARVSAWDLVPGENDFNPEWITERAEHVEDAPGERTKSRFQAGSIRSLALGRKDKPDEKEPAVPEPRMATKPSRTSAFPMPRPKQAPAQASAPERPTPPPPPKPVPPLVPAVERRHEHPAGAPLFVRTRVDMGEAVKMREQLTREWWGSNVRPSNEDIVMRAVARVLEESAAFRRSTDLVGMRALNGTARTVHVLSDPARRPFREAVAGLAALRATPGSEMPCVCTITSFAEFDLDEGAASLPSGQPLALAMGAVRDVTRYRGEQGYRAVEMSVTLSYDSDEVPDGAAARLLARIRELVEAPYALLAH